MPTLTQAQVDALKAKGLDDNKIRAIAAQKGYELPKQSFLGSVGKALTANTRNFGQSIAGAVGSGEMGGLVGKVASKYTEKERTGLEESNRIGQQLQDNMRRRIQEKRDRGEDTSRLINALKTLDSEVNFHEILNESTGNSYNKTAKQIYGEGLGVATDLIGAGALPGGLGAATKAKGLWQGIKTGAKAGAIGGSIFGGSQGVARSAQANKSAGEIVGSGLRGGVEGGVLGGVIGGAIGGISGGIAGRAEKVAKSKEGYVLDLVSPKTNKVVSEQAIREGRVTEPGLLGRSKIIPSTKDYRIADAVDNYVSPKKTTLQNVDAINQGVDEINTGVKRLITSKKVPFNTNQLQSRLNSVRDESKLVFASDATAERTYDAVVAEFMKHVKSKDTLGLFEARQIFDKVPAIKKLLQSEGLGENVKKQIVLDIRRAANEYIASQLPANNPYRALLRQESLMLEAVGNIAEKSASTIGKNKLQILTSKYPIMKWLIGGAATGVVGGAGIGVGSSIIGSTD